MNNKKRCKVLLQTLNMVYDTYPDTSILLRSLQQRFVEVLLAVVFIFKIKHFFKKACIIYGLLCIIMKNHKSEITLLVIGTNLHFK